VRYDSYNASLTNSTSLPASASQNIGFTSVRAGVIYQPTEVQSYYVSYGTSFNPSLETLTLVNGQQSLDPETSAQVELGGKWDLMNGALSLTSAIFEIQKDNTRSQISPGVYELTGNIRVQGFQATAAGRILRNWQVFGGYTFLNAEIVSASALDGTQGKVPANTRSNASVWTTYLHRGGKSAPASPTMSGPVSLQHQRSPGARLPALGRHGRVSAAALFDPAQRAQPDEPAELRCADSFGQGPFGAWHRSPGDADVYL
jgi:outer membrane receptor protein involved in Fe transport